MQTVGKYMIEIWKATGMDMNNVEFLWASEEVRRFFRKGVFTAGAGGSPGYRPSSDRESFFPSARLFAEHILVHRKNASSFPSHGNNENRSFAACPCVTREGRNYCFRSLVVLLCVCRSAALFGICAVENVVG